MVIKILKRTSLLFVLLILWGCPSLDPCGASVSQEITKSDLITISPLQETYSIGNSVILSMVLPSEQTFSDGTQIDIYQKTQIENEPFHYSAFHEIFENNTFTVLEGNYENFTPILYYYSSENEYRFKFKVTLNELGSYSLYAKAEIYFKDPNDDCNSYGINTNIEGMNENSKIEFIVE